MSGPNVVRPLGAGVGGPSSSVIGGPGVPSKSPNALGPHTMPPGSTGNLFGNIDPLAGKH